MAPGGGELPHHPSYRCQEVGHCPQPQSAAPDSHSWASSPSAGGGRRLRPSGPAGFRGARRMVGPPGSEGLRAGAHTCSIPIPRGASCLLPRDLGFAGALCPCPALHLKSRGRQPCCARLSPTTQPSHPSRSSQNTELSSLCYIAASQYLSILHMVVYIFQCHSQFTPFFFPHCVHKYVLYVCISIATWRDGLCSWIGRLSKVKMSVIPGSNTGLMQFLSKSQQHFFID